jgi:DNA-binding NtrC family response regulator
MASQSRSATDSDNRSGGSPKSRRLVLVVELDERWAGIVRALESQGIETDILSPHASPADVVRCATRSDGVVAIDLGTDSSAAMILLAASRRAAPAVPVIVVANNPSSELTRSVRLSGAFYLALQPVDVDEMTGIVQTAFQCLERRRASASRCRAKRRILLIDDDVDFLTSTAALLDAYGYCVSQARTAREGLQMVKSEPPDLVVVDIMMENEWAGYEVNEAIKFAPDFECVRHIPVVMVSSITLDPTVRFSRFEEVEMVTPNLYLTKPLDIPRFVAEIAALLGEPQNDDVHVQS